MRPRASSRDLTASSCALARARRRCVPTCPDALRQAIAGERWTRKLVDLARRDTSDAALIRGTILQLVANWADW